MTDIDIQLPSLRELRAYYAALPAGEEFPDYASDCCLITRPVNEKVGPNGDRLQILPGIEPGEGAVALTTHTGTTIASDQLEERYNDLALAFDERNWYLARLSLSPHQLTYGQCVALIDEYIAIYPEA